MRRTYLVLTLAFWALGAIPGQAEPIPVGGRVVDHGGQPVRGASVELMPIVSRFAAGELWLQGKTAPEPVARTTSGADGRFEITAPAPGMWMVQVSARGFVPVRSPLTPLLEPLELPRLPMARDEPLRVRVVDPQGKPVAGAQVTEGLSTWGGSLPEWFRLGLATTGPDGTVTMPRGDARPYGIQAHAPGYPVASIDGPFEGEVAEVRLAAGCPRAIQVTAAGRPVEGALVSHRSWTLGATDAAGRLSLAAPCDRDLRLQVETRDGRWAEARLRPVTKAGAAEAPPLAVALPAQPVRISGRVQEKGSETPVAGAVVWSFSDPAAFVRTDAKGLYIFTLIGGDESQIAAMAAGYQPDAGRARAGAAGPVLALEPMATASGVVVDEAGRPVAGAEVQAADLDQLGAWNRPPSGRSDAQGRFRVSALASRALTLTARHPGYVAAKLSVPEISPRSSWSGLRLVLRKGLSAAGKVLDAGGLAIAGAEVWLVPAGEGASRLAFHMAADRQLSPALTDAQGRFTLEHLEPGRFDLTATARGFAPTRVPGLELADSPETLDLGTVTLAPGATLHGVVVDPLDSPVAGARVRARGNSGFIPRGPTPTGEEEILTAADGSFSIPDLSPGARVSLTVSKQGYARARFESLEVPRAEPLRIVLPPGSRIAGRVVDPEGEPVTSAFISLSRVATESARGDGDWGRFAARARTGQDGAFVLEGIEAGKVRLVAQSPRFLDAEIPSLEIVAGTDIEGLELVLRPGAVVTGRIIGPDGKPAVGVSVQPVQISGQEGFFQFKAGSADAEGTYRLEGVPEGTHSFEAQGKGFQRAVRELQVKPGENRLDFRLAPGPEVSGRVVDAAGEPVAGATVRLASPGSPPVFWRGFDDSEARTAADGSFRLESGDAGVFDVQAGKEDYAPAILSRVEVAGRVEGLELRLERAGSVHGRLLGLELPDMTAVRISARRLGPDDAHTTYGRGEVDYQGRYRIAGLAAGQWQISAETPDGRRGSGEVSVSAGAGAVLDLELESGGLTLTGRVLRGGEPVPNAGVVAFGQSGGRDSRGYGQTGPQGEFRIRGLYPGLHNLKVSLDRPHIDHHGTVELTGDRDILVEIVGHRLSGRVVDAAGQSPIARARVSLEPTASGPGVPYSPPRESVSDEKGAFAFADLATGTYRVKAQVEGYAPAEATAEVDQGGADGVLLALQPTEGLTLEVRGALGSPPAEVQVALLDPAGRTVLAGNHPTGENGRVRVTSAPPGNWRLLVSATGYATAEQGVQVPGPTVLVTLPRSSTLTVAAPGLTEGMVMILGAGGRPVRLLQWGSVVEAWGIHEGQAVIEGLPAGRWIVRVNAPGQRSWQAEVTTLAGRPARVVVR